MPCGNRTVVFGTFYPFVLPPELGVATIPSFQVNKQIRSLSCYYITMIQLVVLRVLVGAQVWKQRAWGSDSGSVPSWLCDLG